MLEIKDISVFFESFSIEDISLEVEKGEYLTVLGVSGAGKTVLLEVLAGLIIPAKGKVLLNGRDITRQKIQSRGVGLVYQDLSLFPHMKVFENIAFPFRQQNIKGEDLKLRVEQMAAETGVFHLLDRYPGTLSGGEAQRVALARTLASNPEVLLLDEPLSNLDAKIKVELRGLLRKINLSGKTIVHVTHDYMEAATLSSKVAIIENGKLLQTGVPEDVFRHPRSEFVARFSGIRNIFPCTVEGNTPEGELNKAVVDGLGPIYFTHEAPTIKGYIMVPQEDIILSANHLETSAQNQYKGQISEAHLARGAMEVVINAGVDFVVLVSRKSFDTLGLRPGMDIWMNFKASAARFLKN